MKLIHVVSPLALATALGCASSGPSPELIDARRAYDQARISRAAAYAPDRVLEARQALERAEKAHQNDAGSFEEKNLAYVAQRRAELSVIYGNYALDQQNRSVHEQAYKQRQDALRRQAEGDAASTHRELDSARQNLSSTRGALEQEQVARKKAEGTVAAAIASLQQMAQVKEEARGTVITLDGAVLFVSGKSELLPLARQKLDEVAKALNNVDESQKIVVEGHTDSNGSDASNLKLSQDRAEAVRSYLVSQSVKTERITAVGKGETQPIADNTSPEGRANNRRVEIVIQKKTTP